MAAKPRIGFDTRAINLILDDPGAKTILTAIRLGYEVVLPALAVDEIISVPSAIPGRREGLVGVCEQLLNSGQCLFPAHWILTRIFNEHHKDPAKFDWRRVPVRGMVYERAIRTRDFTEDLCASQRNHQLLQERKSERLWKSPRPDANKAFARAPGLRPVTFQDAIELSRSEGSNTWMMGAGLYRRVTGTELDESGFWRLLEVCPPFRAFYFGILHHWFDGALRSRAPLDLKPAGKTDLSMSIYLPYCDKFVADESAQQPSLRDIAKAANIECDVQNYYDFSESFNVPFLRGGAAPLRRDPHLG
jgi:hypothetical protein